MDFTLNFDDDLPLFSDSYDFSLDLEPKISKDIKYHLLSDTLESQKSSPFNPRKDLFITKKIKTSFITIKTDISPKTKNVQCNKNNTSIGRWTKQERIKFVLALNKFGTNWKKMMEYIGTRDLIQIKSHNQKFLKKLKCNEFIHTKGINIKECNWEQSIKNLKERLSEAEFLDVLYSIESELGDNNRMTKKYLERKRFRSKGNFDKNKEHKYSFISTSDESFGNSNINIEVNNNYQNDDKSKVIEYEEGNNLEDEFTKFNNYKNEKIIFDIFKKEPFIIEENALVNEKDNFIYGSEINLIKRLI